MTIIIILGCALVASVALLLRGRPVAINSALSAPPTGLSQTARAARTAALVSAGVPQLYAEKFATDAVEAQAWHDNPEIRQGEQAKPLSPAEKEAKAIADAHRVDPSSAAQSPSASEVDERAAVVDAAQKAAQELAGKAASDLQAARAEREAAERTLADAQAALAKLEAAKAEKKGGK